MAIAPAILASGCGPDLLYLPSLFFGQADVLLRSVPVERAIASGNLTDEQVSKLRLIQDARTFARDRMGLQIGDSFTTFYDTGDSARAYNVSASKMDTFEPVTWSFPFVGAVPYLGFFNEDQARREADKLERTGFDIYMYPIDAYSTLNFLPDPVRSTLLRRGEFSLIDTIIHELLHNTIWRAGDVNFNESLATFVGRAGAEQFLIDNFPDQPETIESARRRYEDIDRYNAFIFDLYNELALFYASDLSSEDKIAGREGIFAEGRQRFDEQILPLMNTPERYEWVQNLPANNAWMLGNYRYNLDLDLFARVHEATGRNWTQSMSVFQSSADAADPIAFLQEWLNESEALTEADTSEITDENGSSQNAGG